MSKFERTIGAPPTDWLIPSGFSSETALWEAAQYTPVEAPLKIGKLWRLTVGGIDLVGMSAFNFYWGTISSDFLIGSLPLIDSPESDSFYLEAMILTRCAEATLSYMATCYGSLVTDSYSRSIDGSKPTIDLGAASSIVVTGVPVAGHEASVNIGVIAFEELN